MALKNHVTSLILSKKLEKLGVKQRSIFYWVNIPPFAQPLTPITVFAKTKNWELLLADQFPEDWENYSAFLSSEIGEMLPLYLEIDKGTQRLHIEKYNMPGNNNDLMWQIGYFLKWDKEGNRLPVCEFIEIFCNKNEAYARASALIYLIEKQLIEI